MEINISPQMKSYSKTGKNVIAFTLVELLTVIAIVCILAALLYPSMQSSLAKSRAMRCVGNLRQLYAAALAYATDHDGLYPCSTQATIPGQPRDFYQAVAPYIGANVSATNGAASCPTFMCPDRSLAQLQVLCQQGSAGSISYGGYMVNRYVFGCFLSDLPIMKTSAFTHLSSTWAIMDGNGYGAMDYPYSSAPYRPAFDHIGPTAPVAQIIMLDGHVITMGTSDFSTTTESFWGISGYR